MRPSLPRPAALALALALALLPPLGGCQCGSGATSSPAPASSAAPPGSEAALASSAPAYGSLEALAAEEAPRVVGALQIVVAWKGAELAPPTVTRSRDEARRRAEEALGKVKEGAIPFAELAKTYSDDVSKIAGGAMGNFERSAVPPALGDAAFALKIGELSGIVETARGFHIVRRVR